jgi:hypothetical protein
VHPTQALLAQRRAALRERFEFNTEDLLRSLQAAVMFDPRKLYNDDWTAKALHELGACLKTRKRCLLATVARLKAERAIKPYCARHVMRCQGDRIDRQNAHTSFLEGRSRRHRVSELSSSSVSSSQP